MSTFGTTLLCETHKKFLKLNPTAWLLFIQNIFFLFLSLQSFFSLILRKSSTFSPLFTISMTSYSWKFQVTLTAKSANFLTMPSVASFGVCKK